MKAVRNDASRTKKEESNMNNQEHPLRAAFRDGVNMILKEQQATKGTPPKKADGSAYDGWQWTQDDSIELVAHLTGELASLTDNGEVKAEDMAVFKDLINHPINPSAFRQRLEAKGRIPKADKKDVKSRNSDLF